jgi:serine/threonine protein kinase
MPQTAAGAGDLFLGQTIAIANEQGNAVVGELLGEGGQGFVYKAVFQGKTYALKWYKPHVHANPAAFYENLLANIRDGAPAANFLWPRHITEMQNGSFGYLMELRPPNYVRFSELLNANRRYSGVDAVCHAALSIVVAFRDLHRKGKSYQDINDGNFFIDPQTGDVMICDNDNVAPYGTHLGILGKCRYMAPEVVTGKKKPDVHTDRFSLSVALFLLMFVSHPLEGKHTLSYPCLSDEQERRLYGLAPVFTLDPADDSNRPVQGVHGNIIRLWGFFPDYVRVAFTKAFTVGMHQESERITENEWKKVFLRMRGDLIHCHCGSVFFRQAFANHPDGSLHCPSCKSLYAKPLVLDVQNHSIPMVPDARLYRCHTTRDSDDVFAVTGQVIRNKSNPGLWGIRNLTNDTWMAQYPDGNVKTIVKDGVVPVLRGMRIDFGANPATIADAQ